jgi:hypothetical protein
VTPSPYYNSSDPEAEMKYKDANAAMYEDADAVFMGYSGDQPKDILFP